MLLVCSWSFHATGQVPVGVGLVVPPWVIGTGPRSTVPFVSSQACFVDRLTHARICGPHGGAAGGPVLGGAELSVLSGSVEIGGPPGEPTGLSFAVDGVAGVSRRWGGVVPAAACAAQP